MNTKFCIISFFLIFFISVISFAESIPIMTKIEDVRENEKTIEFRGCLRGDTQIIKDLNQEIDAKAFILGVEYFPSLNGPAYGGESFLKYKFIGESKKIKELWKETIGKFLSKYSKSDLEEVK